MTQLSSAGWQAVNDVAQRHGFSSDAVAHMLGAVAQGNGTMAQFNHQEFGGSGQWMQGGMIMLSDMFNNYLKGRVDSLCGELSNLNCNRSDLYERPQYQTQGGSPSSVSYGQGGGYGDWWGADLGPCSSSGSQNNVRYAYFAGSRRLAIDLGGTVTIYDTLDHSIGGFGQQQGYGGSLTFSSQYGVVDVANLPVVSVNGQAPMMQAEQAQVYAPPPPQPMAPPLGADSGDVFATIEKLAGLRAKGIISDDEFANKKAELLSRL